MVKNNWTIKKYSGDISGIARACGISQTMATILVNRGIDTAYKADVFLNSGEERLGDPYLMKDMSVALGLLLASVGREETIAIAADYDADGIFSSEILRSGIERLGGKAVIFTPDRREGYGLNRRIVDDAVSAGASVLLTCDNGIAAADAVSYANSRGLTTIITDHHEVPYETDERGERRYVLPEAVAIVDPKRPDCEYPFKGLCGAGVAYMLIKCMYEKRGIKRAELRPLLEYAAIATVADVMDLVEDNRIIVKEGLRSLNETASPGLSALIDVLELKHPVTSTNIAFSIGPCFNASGRMDNLVLAHRLLNAPDRKSAEPIALELKALNDRRKELTEEGVRRAEEEIARTGCADTDRVLVLVLPDTSESIVGIVAGRIKERYHRPVICLASAGGEMLKGSCRSVEDCNIFELLSSLRSCLAGFGGHAMAAGLTIEKENVDEFRRRINDACGLKLSDLTEKIVLDSTIDLAEIPALVKELELLEPTGKGNPRPVFGKSSVAVRSISVLGATRQTVKLRLEGGDGGTTDALMFDGAQYLDKLIRGTYPGYTLESALLGEMKNLRLTIAGYPAINNYGGASTPQMILKSVKFPPDASPVSNGIRIRIQCLHDPKRYCDNRYDCGSCPAAPKGVA